MPAPPHSQDATELVLTTTVLKDIAKFTKFSLIKIYFKQNINTIWRWTEFSCKRYQRSYSSNMQYWSTNQSVDQSPNLQTDRRLGDYVSYAARQIGPNCQNADSVK